MIELEQDTQNAEQEELGCGVCIKVIGVGGAGGNTVNSIVDSGYRGIGFIAVNTDSQALEMSRATEKVQIGVKSTKGLGTGADPEVGRRAAEEDLDKVLEAVGDADIVFVAAGMGGGTGSGAAPVIARALREQGILTIAVITKPFHFEGKRRMRVAVDAVERLSQEVDTLILIPNQKLLEVADAGVSMIDAFSMINEVLSRSVRGISDIIAKPGHINVDFADVRTIMKDCGLAVMGSGRASGSDRARQAALQAISSPLLENMSVEGAQGVLLNITGGKSLGLHEISQAASVVYEQAHEDANIILGSVVDDSLEDEVVVTIIATGFEMCTVPENVERLNTAPATREDRAHADVLNYMHAETEKQSSPDPLKEQEQPMPASCEQQVSASKTEGPQEEEHKEGGIILTDPLTSDERQSIDRSVDTTDLDVPAYLRQQVEQKAND